MINIRKFRKSDAQKLSTLICKTLFEINSRDYSKEIIEKMRVHFSPKNILELANTRDVFVAHNGRNIVGTAALKDDIILSVFVASHLQGKGVGTKLMEHVENIAHQNGYNKVKLPSSITSADFYKKRGYNKVDEVVSDFGKNIIMEKILEHGKVNNAK